MVIIYHNNTIRNKIWALENPDLLEFSPGAKTNFKGEGHKSLATRLVRTADRTMSSREESDFIWAVTSKIIWKLGRGS